MQHKVGCTIENKVMDILEIPYAGWCLVYLHAIEPVIEEIEWTYTTAEEFRCRFFVKLCQFYDNRLIV